MISTSFFTNIIKNPLSPTSLCKITAIALATASLLHATGVMENAVGRTLCPLIKQTVTRLLQVAKDGSLAARVIVVAIVVISLAQIIKLAVQITFISSLLACSVVVIAAGYGAIQLGLI